MARAHARRACASRVETPLDTSLGDNTVPEPGVAKSGDAARICACATALKAVYTLYSGGTTPLLRRYISA